MINVDNYISKLIDLLNQAFATRLLYVGLQGSYLREEATTESDIDIMVIIDELCVADLDRYRSIIQSLEHADKSCGFICSRSDLANWNPLEICHLLHTTKDYYGTLNEYIPTYTRNDIENFVRLSVNNLYHEICHRYVHCRDMHDTEQLPISYKCVFFILQNLYYLKHGKYIATKTELLSKLSGNDLSVLETAMKISIAHTYNFPESFKLLFTWCQETLQSIE